MSPLLVVFAAIMALFLAGQGYLYWRRRQASRFFDVLAGHLRISRRGTRIDLLGSYPILLDAQVTNDDRPEELRLTVRANLQTQARLTLAASASLYDDCKLQQPANEGEPFAGWFVRSEDSRQLAALGSNRGVRESMGTLADLGFTRFEFTAGRLRACWPDFQWNVDQHIWNPDDDDSFPGQVRKAAESLSALATATDAALHSTGLAPRRPRTRATFLVLMFLPLLTMAGGIAASLFLYDWYPTVRDAELLTVTALAGLALAVVYTPITYRLLRESIERRKRTAAVGIVSIVGFCLGSAAPILWWNGTGTQGPAEQVTVDVVRLSRESPFGSVRGGLIRKLIGEESSVEEWFTTYRAIVKSWRDDSLYGIELSAEQFSAFNPAIGELSITVSPGALGLEWYSEVVVPSSVRPPPLEPEAPKTGDPAQ